ncbi:MAG: efflux RND transporter periplasmic adaptor subunit [Candidatus Taylorbacteria bacterium]|nr:efflux RND transporter periplasmic adaptor subunit [Candidatus Taylorbacteria bacterium]
MENSFNRLTKKWHKNKKLWAVGIVIIGIAVWAIFFRGGEKPAYEVITAKKADLIQEVSVTGKIKPAQAVDLQFENSGRIASINYQVGDKVNFGAVIASLENQDLQAQIIEKEAVLESAKADLEKSRKNLDSLTDPAISTALRTDFENARINLENIKTKADDDLAVDYNSAFNAMNEGMTQANSSFIVLKNIRKTYFDTGSDESRKVYSAEKLAEDSIFGFYVAPNDFPGAEEDVAAANTSKTNQNIDLAVKELETALLILKNSYSILQSAVQSNLNIVSTTDRDKVNTEANNVSSELSAVSVAIQNINSQKVTNTKAISDAEQSLAKTQAAFPTPEDIDQKEAAVKQAEAALLSAKSQLRKSLIVAPFAGIVGKIDVERGETVSSSDIAVSLISAADYQLEANITEVDIGKVKIGDGAVFTLDAYGPQAKFNARVSSIDTSATVVEGVTTYKTIFDFDPVRSKTSLGTSADMPLASRTSNGVEGTVGAGIRPDMTANVDIQTAKKDNVISVPQRAVISRNGDKIVRVYHSDNIPPEERSVQLGMSGKDGYVEVVFGLIEGESVITFINE